jgi:hypothetical protein
LRNRPWLATGAAALFLAALYVGFERVAGYRLTEATFKWGALRIVPCFAYGCALYLVYRRAPLPRAGLLALAAAVVMALSASLMSWDGITVLSGGLLILALAGIPANKGGRSRLRSRSLSRRDQLCGLYAVRPVADLAVNVAARLTGSGRQAASSRIVAGGHRGLDCRGRRLFTS